MPGTGIPEGGAIGVGDRDPAGHAGKTAAIIWRILFVPCESPPHLNISSNLPSGFKAGFLLP
jgi:hypothetical protein